MLLDTVLYITTLCGQPPDAHSLGRLYNHKTTTIRVELVTWRVLGVPKMGRKSKWLHNPCLLGVSRSERNERCYTTPTFTGRNQYSHEPRLYNPPPKNLPKNPLDVAKLPPLLTKNPPILTKRGPNPDPKIPGTPQFLPKYPATQTKPTGMVLVKMFFLGQETGFFWGRTRLIWSLVADTKHLCDTSWEGAGGRAGGLTRHFKPIPGLETTAAGVDRHRCRVQFLGLNHERWSSHPAGPLLAHGEVAL